MAFEIDDYSAKSVNKIATPFPEIKVAPLSQHQFEKSFQKSNYDIFEISMLFHVSIK